MTSYLQHAHPNPDTPSRPTHQTSPTSRVLPPVLPRPSTHLLLGRSLAIFRHRREGTDPALRGRSGRGIGRARGVA